MQRALQIGAVAQCTGLSIDAIRFYEKERLLKAPARSAGGYRLFRREDIEDLHFIRGAQELGFSLEETRELLTLRKGVSKPCTQVERLLERKLGSVQERIRKLRAMEAELGDALRECKQAVQRKRTQSEDNCPVLEHISQGLNSGSR